MLDAVIGQDGLGAFDPIRPILTGESLNFHSCWMKTGGTILMDRVRVPPRFPSDRHYQTTGHDLPRRDRLRENLYLIAVDPRYMLVILAFFIPSNHGDSRTYRDGGDSSADPVYEFRSIGKSSVKALAGG